MRMYVEAQKKSKKSDIKNIIAVYEGMANKIIGALSWKNPKNKSLIRDIFKDLFDKELEQEKTQSIEEQIRILRSMK